MLGGRLIGIAHWSKSVKLVQKYFDFVLRDDTFIIELPTSCANVFKSKAYDHVYDFA